MKKFIDGWLAPTDGLPHVLPLARWAQNKMINDKTQWTPNFYMSEVFYWWLYISVRFWSQSNYGFENNMLTTKPIFSTVYHDILIGFTFHFLGILTSGKNLLYRNCWQKLYSSYSLHCLEGNFFCFIFFVCLLINLNLV